MKNHFKVEAWVMWPLAAIAEVIAFGATLIAPPRVVALTARVYHIQYGIH